MKTMEEGRWKTTQLIQLVEQAACCVTLLNPTDPSDVQALQDVLRQIGEAAGSLNQAPLDLRHAA